MICSKRSVQGSVICNSENKKLDVKRSRRELETGAEPLTACVQPERTRKHRPSINRGDPLSIRQLSDEYWKQSLPRCRFVEHVVNIKTALSKTPLPELQRKWSQRRPLPRIFYKPFNESESQQ
ncbi:unnamed protein product [Hymenolepis diminuta]|uniref:Uncharacterized protein n=1 Tax=Hymenolepis diminuta TaxID=6216 RepID=A0A0R3SC71_HYMDI|nr:unnamed protein product [Hymenolepis diminuta]